MRVGRGACASLGRLGSAPDGLVPRCHSLAAMPTLPSTDELAAPSPARVYYRNLPATAIATFEREVYLAGWRSLAFSGRTFHGYGLLKSSCVYRLRCRIARHSDAGQAGAADEAGKPAAVGLGGLGGPFANRVGEGLDVDPVLGFGGVAGEELVVGGVAEERQAAAIAGGGGQGRVDEGLLPTPVGIPAACPP